MDDARSVAVLDMEDYRRKLERKGYISGDDCMIDAIMEELDMVGEMEDLWDE